MIAVLLSASSERVILVAQAARTVVSAAPVGRVVLG